MSVKGEFLCLTNYVAGNKALFTAMTAFEDYQLEENNA
jgi:hypothetical protein